MSKTIPNDTPQGSRTRASLLMLLVGLALGLAVQVARADGNKDSGSTYFSPNCSGCHSVGSTGFYVPPFLGQSAKVVSLAPLASTKNLTTQLPNFGAMATLAGDLTDLPNVAAYFRSFMPDASLSVTKSFSNNSLNRVTSQPTIGVSALCNLNGESVGAKNTSFVAGTTLSVTADDDGNNLKMGEMCTVTETSIAGGGLSGGYLFGFPSGAVISPNGAFTLASSNQVSLTNALIAPVDISRTGIVPFTGTAPNNKVNFTVNDRVGTATQLCLLSPSDPPGSFDGESYYTIVGKTLVNGCVSVSEASPRSFSFDVVFSPGAISTPLDADLKVVSGSSAADPLIVYLHGNPGPVLVIHSLTEFESASLEVDGSVSTPATVTFTNAGTDVSNPLAFGATPFVIRDSTLSGATCGSVPATPAADSGEYTIVGNTCGAELAPTASCSIALSFDPSALGQRCAVLSVNTTNAGQAVIVLAGTGIHGPRLVVSEGTTMLSSGALLDFTSQRPGLAYPARMLTLTNGGSAGQVALDIVLPAASSIPGFTLTPSGGCSQPLQADGATSCTVAVSFTPALVQPYSTSFAFQSRPSDAAPGDPYTSFAVSLAGNGTNNAPVLSWHDANPPNAVSPGLDFGTTSAGTPVDRHVILSNAGPGGAHVSVVNAVGINGVYFQVLSSSCVSDQFLAQNGTCDITVRFAPGGAGAKSANLQMIGDGNGPGALTLQGTGTGSAAPGSLTVTQLSSFGTVRIGAQSAPLEVTLGNSGNFPLRVQSVNVVGPFNVQSFSCGAAPFALAPGASCRLHMTFEPTTSGPGQGTLTVVTDASASPTQVALSGDGQDAADVSSGGCSVADGTSATDPTLWLLMLVAAAILWNRRKSRPNS